MLSISSIIKVLEKSTKKVPISPLIVQNTGGIIRFNGVKSSPEHIHKHINSSIPVNPDFFRFYSDKEQGFIKEKIQNPQFFEGTRENPNYYNLVNIKSEIDSIVFIKEHYPDLASVAKIKESLYISLSEFDSILSKTSPDFESIQNSFKDLYSSVSLKPELADVFGRLYHYQTKIYERHYFNNPSKFESVPNLNAVSLGTSVQLKSIDQSHVVFHPLDYKVNIDTIKYAHEIATLRAASSIFNKKMYHTADKTDVEQMLISQGKNILTKGNQTRVDALVEQADNTIVKKDIKFVHSNKANSQVNKPQIVRAVHNDHAKYCDSHIQRIDRELADSNTVLNRAIHLKATRRIFEQSKLKNDVSLLNQINESEYPFSMIINNDFYNNN